MAKPVCFMVMPFNEKPTNVEAGKGPARVDFDALWDKAFSPLITELGYEPVRADKDLGSFIITEMIERLALADLVIADVTLPNANVYYEIGVRHAAKKAGCVLIAANWSRQVFDIDQMRQLRYPLAEGTITDATAEQVRQHLKTPIEQLAQGTSPVFASIPGFPDRVDPTRVESFKKYVLELSQFQAKVRAVRTAVAGERREKALQLKAKYASGQAMVAGVALELMYLLRDCTDWKTTIEFIDRLPGPLGRSPVMQEQRCLAISKSGDPSEAVGLLETLIETSGDSSERRGLLGGRYKKLYDKTTNVTDKVRFLESAIKNYEQGMYLDLNDYYPASNLARLYRTRGEKGDEDRACMAATVTLAACQRAQALGSGDEWLKPTLLGAAFDAADVTAAWQLYKDIVKEGHAPWKLETTIADLERSTALVENTTRQAELQEILKLLKALL
jgi:hypothetical protein